jgi:AraC-like DNA-binding protein
MPRFRSAPPHHDAASTPDAPIAIVRPSAPLVGCVDHYWFSAAASAPVTVLLPDGRIDVVLECTATRATVRAHGSVTAPTAVPLVPGACYVGVQFRPGAARHVLAVAARELTDRALDADVALSVQLAPLLDTAHPRTLIARLDAALCAHLARMQPVPGRVDHAVALIEGAQGALRIDALAERLGSSRRQIERDFLDTVGVGPKAFAAIVRFQHAAQRLRAGDAIAEAALAAGYADQSDLTRDFRRRTGLTPVAYRDGDVAFFQDGKTDPGHHHGFALTEEDLP